MNLGKFVPRLQAAVMASTATKLTGEVPISHHRFQTDPVGGVHFNNDHLAHPANSHTRAPWESPTRTLPSGSIH